MQANIAFLVPAHESGGWLRGWVSSPVSCQLSFPWLESNTNRNAFPSSPCIYNVNSSLSRPYKTFIRISSSSPHFECSSHSVRVLAARQKKVIVLGLLLIR